MSLELVQTQILVALAEVFLKESMIQAFGIITTHYNLKVMAELDFMDNANMQFDSETFNLYLAYNWGSRSSYTFEVASKNGIENFNDKAKR